MDKKKNNILQTVLETSEFIQQAKGCMDAQSKEELVNFIAKNPLSGDLIPGTGGARKLRWASNAHQGKQGGVMIIYYYYDETLPVFLFSVYAKNQKIDLSSTEKGILYKIIKTMLKKAGGKENE